MEISKEDYAACFKGFQIVDCVVRSKKFFYFVLREDYTQWPNWSDEHEPPAEGALLSKVIVYGRENLDGQKWGYQELRNFEYLLAGISKFPKEQYVGVDMDGNVYVLGNGDDEIENNVPSWREKGPKRGAIIKCRTIDGYLYICGNSRSVGRRQGKNQWLSYTQSIPDKDKDEGFEDIDGFNTNDIYCVGGKGDVWHFDGKKWQQIHFPSNLDLYTVCCAGDGQVYISGYGGTTFKGRGDQWKQIYKGQMTIPFKDMVWYEGKVWCTSDYGLWTIENDTVENADVDPEVKVCSGYLSAADGILLLAGYNGAAYKQDGPWHVIF